MPVDEPTNNPTLEDLHKGKTVLQSEIHSLLDGFETKYRVQIARLDLTRVELATKRHGSIDDVKAVVIL